MNRRRFLSMLRLAPLVPFAPLAATGGMVALGDELHSLAPHHFTIRADQLIEISRVRFPPHEIWMPQKRGVT